MECEILWRWDSSLDSRTSPDFPEYLRDYIACCIQWLAKSSHWVLVQFATQQYRLSDCILTLASKTHAVTAIGQVIVLYSRSGLCCPMHCDLFKIFCAPPNLGIARTWICRLNFAQRPIFSGLMFFNEPEISDSGPPALDFYVLRNPSTSAGFETANLGFRSEHVTPRATVLRDTVALAQTLATLR